MKKILSPKFFALFALVAMSFGGLFFTPAAKAQFDPIDPCASSEASANCVSACKLKPDSALCVDSKQSQPQSGEEAANPVTETIGRVANIVAVVVGVISVIIVIIAGITMTLSSGDASKVKSSRDAIIFACVGVLVVVIARTIITFIINRL